MKNLMETREVESGLGRTRPPPSQLSKNLERTALKASSIEVISQTSQGKYPARVLRYVIPVSEETF